MINIAIDGFAGSGKSSIAKLLAETLGYKMLNTGEIYRAMACEYKNMNLGEPNDEIIKKFVNAIYVDIKFEGDRQLVFVNGEDYSSQLREEEISLLSSRISAYPALRDKILAIQRDFAEKNDCVIEGRDIATVVIPNAQIKFFVIASAEVRAQRRFKQLQNISFEQVLKDILDRDYADQHRNIAPLKKAEDAIIIDTTMLNEEQALKKCLEFIDLVLEK